MSQVDRSVLVALKTFAGWPPADLDLLLAPARSTRFAKGSTVFEQDAPAASFYLLLDGHIQASKLTPDGRQVIIRYIEPGELFGIAAPMRQHAYPASARAIVDSVALVWPSTTWPELAARFPALSASVLRAVGDRLVDANARVLEMSTEAVERRVAHALLRLARQSGREVEGGVEIVFPLTRQDLAEMTGTTLFTVSRILRAWEGDGLVASRRRRIVVRRADRLSALAEGGEGP
ncbi:MAG: Crp/Fnr family transcriptional regulator [Roseiarcus sp.]|jgi:CRP-like cAMP-binding protein